MRFSDESILEMNAHDSLSYSIATFKKPILNPFLKLRLYISPFYRFFDSFIIANRRQWRWRGGWSKNKKESSKVDSSVFVHNIFDDWN